MNNKYNDLKKNLKNAYAPYSKFFVSAIVIPKENKNVFFNGVNIENSSFGATICAERSAICAMVSNGYKIISELHLLTSSVIDYVFPCGICRQFISEFINEGTKIYIYNWEGNVLKKSFSDIMPNQIFKNKEIK